jgi:hypothetical protein
MPGLGSHHIEAVVDSVFEVENDQLAVHHFCCERGVRAERIGKVEHHSASFNEDAEGTKPKSSVLERVCDVVRVSSAAVASGRGRLLQLGGDRLESVVHTAVQGCGEKFSTERC